jgi:cyanophycinase-like exopeptidase
MNVQPIYLFAGGRGRSILTTFAEIGKVFKTTGKAKPDVAIVGVASLKDNYLIYLLMSTLIKAGCKCNIKRVVIARRNADIEKAREILRKADAVFMSGGDAEVGMQVLQEKEMVGFFRDLAGQGKLFIGGSAGTIMMCKKWVRWRDCNDDSTAELYPCLGLVPLICDTHAEGDDWVELKMALQLEGDGAIGYGITSGAYLKVYPDGLLEAEVEPVSRYINVKGKIERQAELLPAGHAL